MADAAKLNREIVAFKNLFTSEDGRLVLGVLKRNCNRISLPKNEPVDPFKTHYQLGKMWVYDFIIDQIDRELLPER